MLKLFFTGAGGSGTEAIVNLLGGKYVLHFADAQQKEGVIHPIVGSDYQHNIPWANSKNYVQELVSLLTTLNIDMFVPGVDEELAHIEALQSALPGLDVLAPEPEYIKTMIDKKNMALAMGLKGLPTPGAYSLDIPEDLDFPIIAKPRSGRGSRGVRKLDQVDDVHAYIQLSGVNTDELVAQNYLEGDEYTVMMSANSAGYLQSIVPVKVEEKRGITIRAKVVNDSAVVDTCKNIHSRYRAKGCYNIQMMKISNGEVIPFEINPRVSTTFCLGIAAGIDPIENYYSSNSSEKLQEFTENIVLRRYWMNHIK